MIGMFSFRELTLKETIEFWYDFVVNDLKIKLDYVTIHPDKYEDWKQYYHDVDVRKDSECTWSDGEITGYCTEFYSNGVEIGNIVNPLGTCIDVGFGFERLDFLVNGTDYFSEEHILKNTISKMIDDGYIPSNLMQGYVLRKLLRLCYKKGFKIDHKFYYDEIERQRKIFERYEKLKVKHKDKSKEWWFDTHGIDLAEL
jgi:alanyl-tRNA synthetase